MKAGNSIKLPQTQWLLACSLAVAFAASACNGDIGGGAVTPGGTAGGTSAAAGAGSIPGGSAGGPMMMGPGVAGMSGAAGGAPATVDPGRISIHRLNNLEYDNTMRDLLGYTGNVAQTTFQPDEKGEFDNAADSFTMNDARYEQYFNTADTIGEAVFTATANPLLASKTKILSCPPSATDMNCTKTIINGFGLRAWRRPLIATEVDSLVTLYQKALTLMETPENSIKHVVKTMLASPQFLYRIEFDPSPASLTAHALTPYEMISRLSYLGWSSMPDDALFQLANSNGIVDNTIVTQQVDRMLADAKGAAFTESFAGQWLGARDLKAHQVEPTAFAGFDDALRAGMIKEELAYFNEFLTGTLPMTAFFNTDINFVDTALAAHYKYTPAPPAGALQKVSIPGDTRVGFMGLASFQTFTSFSYRTAPTLRGKWVLLNLLCQKIPEPPASVPKLDGNGATTDPALQSQNVRIKLAAHRTMMECATCHATLDPIGLGLENFDAIGQYRTKYANGDTIDSSGVLPTKETFSTTAQLSDILSKGIYSTKLTDCASQKMMTYSLSRSLVPEDMPYLAGIRARWATTGYGLRALMKEIVVSDPLRFRRGEL